MTSKIWVYYRVYVHSIPHVHTLTRPLVIWCLRVNRKLSTSCLTDSEIIFLKIGDKLSVYGIRSTFTMGYGTLSQDLQSDVFYFDQRQEFHDVHVLDVEHPHLSRSTDICVADGDTYVGMEEMIEMCIWISTWKYLKIHVCLYGWRHAVRERERERETFNYKDLKKSQIKKQYVDFE